MVMSKRDRLIESAAELFHQQGMGSTSLADIAKHAEIPIGNVYYYFKTKEELALAALDKRQQLLDQAYKNLEDAESDPRVRLIEAVRFFERMKDDYTRYGCPIGKLVMDSTTEKDAVSKAAANELERFVGWADRQFTLLGHNEEGKAYAISLMAGVEGAAVMAKAFSDVRIFEAEIGRLVSWLTQLPNKTFLGKVSARSPENA